ncbi:MAG: hypothetical protein K0U41_09630 [Gammaproteobacteria bacterium]|nr:hypothetical protein [Gammaproteobacteria bacterium]
MIHKGIQSALANLYFFTQIAIKQLVKALAKPHAQASARITAAKQSLVQVSPTKSLPYIINCVGFGLALLLSACTYNGLSGSSGGGDDTTAINGLWIQQEQATLTGGEKNCGCRDGGTTSGSPRRCYSYFADGIVVSGYLTAADASNCANELTLNPSDRAEFNRVLSDLARTARNTALLGSAGSVRFSYAVGTFHAQSSATVTGSGPTLGEYFNIRYQGSAASLARREIICTSYATRDDNLYLAGDPSGGGQVQDQDPTACNSARFTNLIRYEKVSP